MLKHYIYNYYFTALCAKLLLLALLFSFYRYTENKGALQFKYFFPVLGGILVLRDILYYFTQSNELLIISDLLIINLYILFCRRYIGGRRIDPFVFSINAFFVLFITVNIIIFILSGNILQIIPDKSFYFDPGKLAVFYRIFLFLNIVYLTINLYQAPGHTAPDSKIILQSRLSIASTFLLYNLLMLIFNHKSTIVHMLFIPGSYWLHFFLLHLYNSTQDEKNKELIWRLRKHFASLYEFMQTTSTAAAEKTDIASLLDYIVATAVKSIKADSGAILWAKNEEESLYVASVMGIFPPPYPIPATVKVTPEDILTYFKSTPVKFGETVLGESFFTGKPEFIPDTSLDLRMKY
ncbi:MAG: hypothetical protein AB1798_13205, partial [Spirochaetota bacterium]